MTSNIRKNVTLGRVLATIVTVEKQEVLRIVSACVALVNRHAMRMRHISSLACPALQYFFHNIL
jgi:hypothetical protein